MPKTISPALQSYLAGFSPAADQPLCMADLYTITLQAGSTPGIATGQVLAYTDFHDPVAWNSLTYLANSVLVSGLKYKCTTGVDADAQQITFAARPIDTVGSIPFLQALAQGLLDGAEIQRERAFFRSRFGSPPFTPIGTVLLFKGRVTKIDSIGRTQAKVTVESDLTILKDQMPKNAFTPSCVWPLYGTGCGLSASSFTFSGAVGAGSTATTINWSGASPSFAQGTLTFTSGANTGVTATIKAASFSTLTPIHPLPSAPAAGDAFTASWGCDHTLGATFTGSISGATLTVSATGLGVIANGPLFGASVVAGQTITGQTGGPTGGVGSYSLGISQATVASEAMQTGNGCAKFNNQANYRGFPLIPPPQIVTGPLATTANAGKG